MKQIMKDEAIKRLNKLNISSDVKSLFTNEDRLFYSERQNKLFPATLFYLENNKDFENKVKEFEKETGHLAFHAIHTYTTFGEILDILFISKYEDDWEWEFEKINENEYRVMSTAINLTDNSMSDMGSIIVRQVMGGLERIA